MEDKLNNDSHLIYVTGGTRSGKSSYGLKLALSADPNPVFVATAVNEKERSFQERIKRHQAERGPEWTSLEEGYDLAQLDLEGKTVLIDCVTLWLNNLFEQFHYETDSVLNEFRKQIDSFRKKRGRFIFIGNEIGMGLHGLSREARAFTDLHGWAAQYLASVADEVILMVSGIPLYVKKNINDDEFGRSGQSKN